MRTFFKHKHYGPWPHALTKQWHQMDHVKRSHKTAGLLKDVNCLPGSDFNGEPLSVQSYFACCPPVQAVLG